MRKTRIIKWLIGGVSAVVLLFFLGAWLAQEPLRKYMEDSMNRSLDGYSVKLESVDLHLLGLAVTLRNLLVVQDAHPEKPVADIPYLNASVHWRDILNASLVADFEFREPRVHLNLQQLRQEAADEKPVEERGWQEAARSIYPLEINLLTIREGDLTYIDEDPDRPLHFEKIFFQAENIRNIASPEETYPSSVQMDATIFQTGSLRIDGDADFLKEPYLGINSRVELAGVPLDYLRPVLSRYNFFISGGELSATGNIEYSPDRKYFRFAAVNLKDLKADYRLTGPATDEAEQTQKEAAKEATTADAPEKAGKEEIVYRVEELRATGEFGMVDPSADPEYRIFLSGIDLQVNNLSNGFHNGEARANLTGSFMGSGRTEAAASFRPEEKGPDFDLSLEIRETSLPAMNNMLRAYANFDVTAGTFSLVSEIDVKHERVKGYIKPFFKNVNIYDPQQDEEKGFFNEVYQGIVGTMAAFLENEPRDQVATRTDFSGKLSEPSASTWQAIVNLIRNAYFSAILPTFEQEATAAE